jgi:nicotinamide mononucleotide transporter
MDGNLILELFGAITGLLYVYFEIVQKRAMWVVGGISALTYIAVFLGSGLYAATILQVCFFGMSIYGWIVWGRPAVDGDESRVKKMSRKVLFISLAISTLAYFPAALSLRYFSEDPMPYIDALTTILSLLATYWVTNKYTENWIIWIISNSIAIYLYANQGLYPTVLLYVVYLVAAVIGYWHWRKIA